MKTEALIDEHEDSSSVELEDYVSNEEEKSVKIDMNPDEIVLATPVRVIYQTNSMLLPHIVRMIRDDKVIELQPEYQRRKRWNLKQKSKLIESLILNVPIPSIYWYETDLAKYEVMDGQQRLTSISEFFNNEFKLTGLLCLEKLNGLKYKELSSIIKRTIDRSSLNTVLMLLENNATVQNAISNKEFDLRRMVFERLNTGGINLNPQEVRNAMYPGPLNDAIDELSRHRNFTDAFGFLPFTSEDPEKCDNRTKRMKRVEYKTMKDCEIVLRFFAFKDRKNIRGSLISMLDRALENGQDESNIESEKELFLSRFDFLFELFEQKPFRLNVPNGRKPRISVSLYDALMVAINELWIHRDKIQTDKHGVKQRLNASLEDIESYRLLTGRTSGARAIINRIELAKSILYSEDKR